MFQDPSRRLKCFRVYETETVNRAGNRRPKESPLQGQVQVIQKILIDRLFIHSAAILDPFVTSTFQTSPTTAF